MVRAGGGDHRRQRALRAGRPAALSAKALLLDAHLTEGESEARRHRLQLSGLLPQGWFGSLLLEEIDGEMGKLARLRPLDGDKQAVEIDIALAQGQLQAG